jgi:ABC transporter fused permease/ATP-binding protein
MFKKLVNYTKPYKIQFSLFVICVLLTSLSMLAIGKALGYFIDKGFASGDDAILLKSLALLLLIITILAFAMFGRFFIITYYGEKVIADIKVDLFQNLIRLSPEFFEKNKIGELISHITNDLTILQTTISSSLSIFLRNSLMFFGCLFILLYLDFKLTLIVFALIPIVILPLILLGKRLREISKIAQDRQADVLCVMEENISLVKLIQSYANENFVVSRFNEAIKSSLIIARLRILIRSLLTVTVLIIVFAGVAVILYQGGVRVFASELTVGEFSSFLFYTILMTGSFAAMSEVFGNIQKAKGATSRLFALLEEKTTIEEGKSELDKFEKLEFKNVSFTYPSRDKKSLNNINLQIKPGQIIALVGSSGAGKTTIFELLQRFYDVNNGEIIINGENIKNYKLNHLRQIFALVPQDSFLFSTSVKDNLSFARQTSTVKEMEQAVQMAKADKFIVQLPEKYDSYIGEKGIRISSGEKQRLAIARAFLKKSDIILLDEPTSNLDGENEKYLQKILTQEMQGKTIIIIAHRLSTIRKADNILVMEEGQIVESGTHEELCEMKGLYKKLLELQFEL